MPPTIPDTQTLRRIPSLADLVHAIGVLVIDDRLLERRHLMLGHLEVDHALPRGRAIPAIARLGVNPEESIHAIRQAPILIGNIRRLFD